jgi:diaminohydroxyphosphoribosylaminopyrimidine deaminase/5-amino-6-(5-phosphoribosylamino)uracil reductase
MQPTDSHYLCAALTQAQVNRGFCSPNPAVGAIIVKDHKVLATGFHLGPGTHHAEVDAIKKLSPAETAGATIYISLEPCCHFGRTPPCTDALIQAGIKRVVYGYEDPNPLVKGKSQSLLQAANISCDYLPIAEIDAFYQSYSHWHLTKMPFITAKIALTLDGKMAGKLGQPIAITGPALQEFTHQSRKLSDAILTTAETILKDDPQLNIRLKNTIFTKPIYILDRQLKVSPEARIFST